MERGTEDMSHAARSLGSLGSLESFRSFCSVRSFAAVPLPEIVQVVMDSVYPMAKRNTKMVLRALLKGASPEEASSVHYMLDIVEDTAVALVSDRKILALLHMTPGTLGPKLVDKLASIVDMAHEFVDEACGSET